MRYHCTVLLRPASQHLREHPRRILRVAGIERHGILVRPDGGSSLPNDDIPLKVDVHVDVLNERRGVVICPRQRVMQQEHLEKPKGGMSFEVE
jgi:hypothetical protein